MSDPFTLGGSPASIRASGAVWLTFSTSSNEAASDIRSIDSGDFRGDEGDTYRDQVNSDLPPHLDTTSEAWGIVGRALTAYADKLEGFQSKLATLSTQHAQDQNNVSSAQSSVSTAKTADQHHDQSVQQAKSGLKPGQTLPPDTYKSGTSSANSALSSAQQAQQDTIDAANKVQSDHTNALNDCVNDINRAKDMRFQKPPGWWDRMTSSVCGWIKDHADMLLKVASVLKTISSIAGILAFIPILSPIMTPIAIATGVAAVGIEAGVKLATGKGSWTSIGIDALTMTPLGGKVLGVVGKGLAKTPLGKVATTGLSKVGNTLSETKLGALAVKGKGLVNTGINKVDVKIANGLDRITPNGLKFASETTAAGNTVKMVKMPNRPGYVRTVKTGAGGETQVTVTRLDNSHSVTVKAGDGSLTHEVPTGTGIHTSNGAAPPKTSPAPRALGTNRRPKWPNNSNGVAVGKSANQNAAAEQAVADMKNQGATDIRVDQAQTAPTSSGPAKVGTNRPDVSGTVGDKQRVSLEYDPADGARVDGHVNDNLAHDPGAIVITVPIS